MQLYVGGLAENTAENELHELFSQFGSVESVEIVRELKSGRSRGFGLVRMLDSSQAEAASKQLNGRMVGNRQINVTRMPATLPGEMEFREWMRENAREVLLEAGIREGHTVLDYGCGPGIFTLPCARITGREGKVFALEVRSGALERIKEKAKTEGLDNIETILQNSAEVVTNLPDGSMDAVLVYDVMHDIPNKQGLLVELHRVLKPDGLLSIFPMHLGTDKMLAILDESGLFCLKGRYGPLGHQAVSEILNLNKC